MRNGMYVVVTAALVLAVAGWAPTTAAAQAAKIGVVDVGRILAKSQAGVAARDQLEREKATMQKEVDNRRKELEALKDELEKK
ncbi:MAG: OmpH family outer membrane protein, partial [Candidatus Rokubacteria bacterium]|nr:OmpH family outer membrane protein [Candidatus Rokubacteria bacterium]